MANAALFVDLPNFYSHLLKSGIEEPRFLKEYFLCWLDFDLLAEALTKSFSGIWVFYSGQRIGPSDERVEGKYLKKYIDRINALRGVTARNVNVPGEQREYLVVKCHECGGQQTVEHKSEKGVDASLTVHLFDTMDSWDIAYLLSGDADFMPAVASLRRRGKIVVGAGFPARSPALVRECYDYIDLSDAFLKQDIAAYMIFRESDGVIQKWFSDELHPRPGYSAQDSVELMFSWGFTRKPAHFSASLFPGPRTSVDLSERCQLIEGFQAKFPDQEMRIDSNRGTFEFIIDPIVGIGIERRLRAFVSSVVTGLQPDKERELRTSFRLEYQYNDDENSYIPVP